MREVLISGTGMTRFAKQPEFSVRTLAEEAAGAALADASSTPDEVDMVFFANATAGLITGQEMIRGQSALRHSGLLGKPIINVESACASGSTAVHLAWMAVAGGQSEAVLVVGAEKLSHPDKKRSFDAIGSAIDMEEIGALREQLYGGATPGEGTLFMDIYAALTRRYMSESGASPSDFAKVVVKNHKHGSLNPHAQYRNLVTEDEVLSSRMISDPLTLLMCSPIGDGAAALLLTSRDYATRRNLQAVMVRASAVVSGVDEDGQPSPARAAALAYEQAGLGPQDIDVAEVHDAAAPAELIIYEELGFAAAGDGPKLIASDDTALGGRLPVNPSGGLISKGHPIGATGCAQLVELADQLRGRAGQRQVEGARIGLAENAGGYLGPDQAAATVTIVTS